MIAYYVDDKNDEMIIGTFEDIYNEMLSHLYDELKDSLEGSSNVSSMFEVLYEMDNHFHGEKDKFMLTWDSVHCWQLRKLTEV